MNKFNQFKNEWSETVKNSKDPKATNGRPSINSDIFNQIIGSIINNFDLNNFNNSIVDVGCGNGSILSALSKYCIKQYGCDYCQEMIKIAKNSNPKAKILIGEANKLPFKDKIANIVLCYSIFQYFPSDEYAYKCIEEMVRVTEDEGKILIGDILDKQFQEKLLLSDNKAISDKMPLIHRYSEWLFFDLSKLLDFCKKIKRVKYAKIIEQKPKLPFSNYRKDLLLCL